MHNVPAYFSNSDVAIGIGEVLLMDEEVNLGDDIKAVFRGRVYVLDYPSQQLRIACSLSPELNMFHSKVTGSEEYTRAFLQRFDFNQSFHRILAEHKDNILVNPLDNSIPHDAVIFTKSANSKPIVLAIADCLGIVIVDEKTGLYGVCHAGRAGIGIEIIPKFVKAILAELQKMGEPLEASQTDRLKFTISPHIFPADYSHPDNKFMQEPGWQKMRKFVFHENDNYYPDIASAGIQQLIDTFTSAGLSDSVRIQAMGLNTFTEGASYRRSRDLDRNCLVVGLVS